jgi:hypothetical protein
MKIKQYFIGLYIRFKGRPAAKQRAIKKAKALHAETGKHYRVYFMQNKYQVLTRQDLQFRKHIGEFGWHVNSTKMKPFCFYDTTSDIVYPHLKTA